MLTVNVSSNGKKKLTRAGTMKKNKYETLTKK